MDEKKQGWKQYTRITLDKKRLARRVKKAEGATQRHAHRFIIRRIDNIRLVSREITLWLLIVSAIIAAIGVQILVGQDQFMTSAAVGGGTYVEGVVGQVDSMNPLYISTPTEGSVSKLLFSSLYSYDETGSLKQDLANKMEVNEAGVKYTVTLRDDVSWHDGNPLGAQDIVFTINLIKNPATRSPLRVNWLDVSVVAVNETTVEFTLPATYAAFPHALTFPVLPEHILKPIAPGAIRESTFSSSPIGSGPFTFRRLQMADTINDHKVVHVAANKDYYGGRPKLDRFEIHAYPDEESLIKALNSGELSGASGLSPVSRDQITSDRYSVTAQPLHSGVYVLFNLNNPVLKDIKVRRALQAGTDTAQIRKDMGGRVLPLDGPLLISQLEGDDIPRVADGNIDQAIKLLDEAGWKLNGSYRVKGDEQLSFAITTTKNSEFEKVLNSIEKQWQKLGIKVEKTVLDPTVGTVSFVQDVLQARNFDMLLYELSIGGDPDVYAYWHSSQVGQAGYNFTGYSSQRADASLASARSRIEPDLRNAKYKQFVREWQNDVPAIGVYQSILEYVSRDSARAVQKDSQVVVESDRYANVQYWTVTSDTVYKTP
ncbi:peptide ABC transporter substrate-binding protein [Candidatus Saccharibacteria bacterium]|nr:peptide ABC transporter substrate-binding protein [Candidatus Saccharibacteria bacterium]